MKNYRGKKPNKKMNGRKMNGRNMRPKRMGMNKSTTKRNNPQGGYYI